MSSRRVVSRRLRLWTQLALFAVAGVIATHAVHLVLGNRISTDTLAKELEDLGEDLVRAIGQEATDAVLVNDTIALQQIARRAVSGDVVYCLIARDGVVLASSFQDGPPAELAALRQAAATDGTRAAPIVVRHGGVRMLDVEQPLLDGKAGSVRIGIDMRILDATRRSLAIALGLIALLVMAIGIAAALLVGRSVARPMGDLVDAANRFDQTHVVPSIKPRGSREMAELVDRFNEKMTRVRDAHDALDQARQKGIETERLVALGTLVSGLAHEINNPLAGLKNCHRLIERGGLPEDRQREYIGLIGEAVGRIEDVVSRLLDFGRPQPLRLAEIDAREIVRDAARVTRPLLGERHVTWREPLELEERDVTVVRGSWVVADRRQVVQALVNLVLNALYVTRAGGEIRVALAKRPGFVGITIEDDGPGIPLALRGRVFDPFFSTKPEGEGTGLGLSVTRTIIGAHGGDVTFDFPDSGGTRATVWLREARGLSAGN